MNQHNEHYVDLRARANAAGDEMARSFEEAHQAYERGDGGRAKELSNKGKAAQQEILGAGAVAEHGEVPIGPEDRFVLAVPPWAAAELLPGLAVPTEHRSIVNAHFAALPAPSRRALRSLVG